MRDKRGVTHYMGADYLKTESYVGTWLMTNDCNIPRKVLKDEINEGIRDLLLSNYPLVE